MIALIDGDLVAYRTAASAENDGLEIALVRANNLMTEILHKTKAESYKCLLSGEHNFRKEIDPNYKANRDDVIRPQYLQQVREYLVTEWKSEVTDGIEADDALGIAQTACLAQQQKSIICSLDKDLLQIPGHHFSWEIRGTSHGKEWVRPDIFREVSYIDGLRTFYASSLIGDVSDNITGVKGIGKARAPKYFSDLGTEGEMYQTCWEMYDRNTTRLNTNLKLLWLMREENDVFDPIKRGLSDLSK